MHKTCHHFSLSLRLKSVAVLGLRESVEVCPSRASRSRKSLHSSASDSLLVGVAFSSCVPKLGVLGVRLNGLGGSLSVDEEDDVTEPPAPGLASPACSLCSTIEISKCILKERALQVVYLRTRQALEQSTARPGISSGRFDPSPKIEAGNSLPTADPPYPLAYSS